MLAELRVQNLAIIEDLQLTLGPGLNVLTGETGAGKSIIIESVSLLLGERADQEAVRAGAEQAHVEGVFHLSPFVAQALRPILQQNGLEGDDQSLILAREVRVGGRSVSRVNGRAVSLQLLREISERLVDIHGQGGHLSLLRVREHVHLLDRYGGLEGERARFAEQVRALRQVRQQLAALRQDERELARRMDLLTFQIGEITAAQLQEGEGEEHIAERNRLANAEQLARLTDRVVQALEAESVEQPAALDQLGEAIQNLHRLEAIDPTTQPLRTEAETAADALQEIVRSLSGYREEIEFSPQRLNRVQERLALIHSLQRKYGDTIADVLAFGAAAQAELESITHSEERIAELEAEEERLLRSLGRLGVHLSAQRHEAAERLSSAVECELADLGMAQARFGVEINQAEDPAGAFVDGRRLAFDASGLDRVEFLVTANPGEPLRPLVKVASGGETSRLMLALKAVLSHADATPTLIFDEIDSGIGGRVGAIVGEKLWRLTAAPMPGSEDAAGHQVLCVTHLPQLAAYGDQHIEVRKKVVDGRTVTVAETISGEARVRELAQMLGAMTDAARQSVQEMLSAVDCAKESADEADGADGADTIGGAGDAGRPV